MLSRSAVRSIKAQGKLPMRRLSTIGPSRAAVSTLGDKASRRARPARLPACTCHLPAVNSNAAAGASFARPFTTSPARRGAPSSPQVSSLTDREYHEIADGTMDSLVDRLEALQEELDEDDFDVEYSSGVLTVKLPYGHGTYVVNKQPPNKQIWLSSPTSGPKRYDWSSDEKSWFYARDGTRMLDLLETELSEKLRTSVSFKA